MWLITTCVDVLPSPFDPSPDESRQLPQSAAKARDTNMVEPDYNWATFIHAYSMGRWDPLKTPLQPRSHLHAPSLPRAAALDTSVAGTSSDTMFDSPELDTVPEWRPAETPYDPPSVHPKSVGPLDSKPASIPEIESGRFAVPSTEVNGVSTQHPSAIQPSSPWLVLTESTAGPSKPSKSPNMPLNLGPFSHRLRNSFADMRTSSAQYTQSLFEQSRHPITPADATATAAAIRLAAARVSVAPLALPSPEHELTDPMRGVTATIPGSHPDVFANVEPLPLLSPNTSRKSRLSSFWQGTQDVDDGAVPAQSPAPSSTGPATGKAVDSTVEGKGDSMQDGVPLLPSRDTSGPPSESRRSSNSSTSTSVPAVKVSLPPPATAPAPTAPEPPEDDYFGNVDTSRYSGFSQPERPTVVPHPAPAVPRAVGDLARQASAPPFEVDPQSVPALPRRICLTRQTSAPLPTASLYERRLRASRPASESQVNNLAGRAAKEEQMFLELGYLAPPNPPNELERRRALYKYNIWGTGRDPNFDRIAHLVKLVFNTRIVIMALIDGTEQ